MSAFSFIDADRVAPDPGSISGQIVEKAEQLYLRAVMLTWRGLRVDEGDNAVMAAMTLGILCANYDSISTDITTDEALDILAGLMTVERTLRLLECEMPQNGTFVQKQADSDGGVCQ